MYNNGVSLINFDNVVKMVYNKVSRKRTKEPSIRTMEKWMFDGVAKATDGCQVEPDGICVHGCKSWLMELGYI